MDSDQDAEAREMALYELVETKLEENKELVDKILQFAHDTGGFDMSDPLDQSLSPEELMLYRLRQLQHATTLYYNHLVTLYPSIGELLPTDQNALALISRLFTRNTSSANGNALPEERRSQSIVASDLEESAGSSIDLHDNSGVSTPAISLVRQFEDISPLGSNEQEEPGSVSESESEVCEEDVFISEEDILDDGFAWVEVESAEERRLALFRHLVKEGYSNTYDALRNRARRQTQNYAQQKIDARNKRVSAALSLLKQSDATYLDSLNARHDKIHAISDQQIGDMSHRERKDYLVDCLNTTLKLSHHIPIPNVIADQILSDQGVLNFLIDLMRNPFTFEPSKHPCLNHVDLDLNSEADVEVDSMAEDQSEGNPSATFHVYIRQEPICSQKDMRKDSAEYQRKYPSDTRLLLRIEFELSKLSQPNTSVAHTYGGISIASDAKEREEHDLEDRVWDRFSNYRQKKEFLVFEVTPWCRQVESKMSFRTNPVLQWTEIVLISSGCTLNSALGGHVHLWEPTQDLQAIISRPIELALPLSHPLTNSFSIPQFLTPTALEVEAFNTAEYTAARTLRIKEIFQKTASDLDRRFSDGEDSVPYDEFEQKFGAKAVLLSSHARELPNSNAFIEQTTALCLSPLLILPNGASSTLYILKDTTYEEKSGKTTFWAADAGVGPRNLARSLGLLLEQDLAICENGDDLAALLLAVQVVILDFWSLQCKTHSCRLIFILILCRWVFVIQPSFVVLGATAIYAYMERGYLEDWYKDVSQEDWQMFLSGDHSILDKLILEIRLTIDKKTSFQTEEWDLKAGKLVVVAFGDYHVVSLGRPDPGRRRRWPALAHLMGHQEALIDLKIKICCQITDQLQFERNNTAQVELKRILDVHFKEIGLDEEIEKASLAIYEQLIPIAILKSSSSWIRAETNDQNAVLLRKAKMSMVSSKLAQRRVEEDMKAIGEAYTPARLNQILEILQRVDESANRGTTPPTEFAAFQNSNMLAYLEHCLAMPNGTSFRLSCSATSAGGSGNRNQSQDFEANAYALTLVEVLERLSNPAAPKNKVKSTSRILIYQCRLQPEICGTWLGTNNKKATHICTDGRAKRGVKISDSYLSAFNERLSGNLPAASASETSSAHPNPLGDRDPSAEQSGSQTSPPDAQLPDTPTNYAALLVNATFLSLKAEIESEQGVTARKTKEKQLTKRSEKKDERRRLMSQHDTYERGSSLDSPLDLLVLQDFREQAAEMIRDPSYQRKFSSFKVADRIDPALLSATGKTLVQLEEELGSLPMLRGSLANDTYKDQLAAELFRRWSRNPQKYAAWNRII